MQTYIALLRGINVSGHKLIKMAELQQHFASFGAVDPRTYIQSGNVVFGHGAASATLRKNLEKHLADELGYAVPVLIKSANKLAVIARANPYDIDLPELGKKMYVCFFEHPPGTDAIKNIQPFISDNEQLMIKGHAGYAYYADGLGKARLTSTVIERKLGMATLRNWNTVTALLEMADS
ncbi:MAG TPA: DUF1697 domain-containing protein [Candidatus Sulfotelmatobacter sp.]|jgi:uncharacterized protein (DUF1697 family)|nr:DUF1697 domain-containing protein [Candidatus Sulfotelmatobacter sp.]